MKTDLEKHVELAEQRINVYGLLAAIYRQEVQPDLLSRIRTPQFRGVLAALAVEFGDEFYGCSDKEVLEDLAVEYTRLFLGPGKHIPPYESVHHERGDGDWGRLWGADTVQVKAFIEATGLTYQDEYRDMPDHISVEMELMRKIAERERQAWEEADEDVALYCLKIEKKFLSEHLSQWVPLFSDKVISEANLPFYREIARMTRDFIEFEQEHIDEYVSEARA